MLFQLETSIPIKSLTCYKQLLEREGIDERIESLVSGRGMVEDHNWNRKKQRFCVHKVGNVIYYPEETGDSTRPAQRVVAIKNLWDTLVGVQSQLSHGGRQRMEKHLIEHGTHVPRPVRRREGGRARTRLYTSQSSQTPLGNAGGGGFANGTRRIEVYPQLPGLLQQVRHPASAQDQDSG